MTRANEALKDFEKASNIQKTTRMTEKEKRDSGIDYDEKYVRQSIVHTREDVVLLVSLSTSVLGEIKANNRRLSIIILLLALGVLIFLIK